MRLQRIDHGSMENVYTRIRSVLDCDKFLRISHQSFTDFLLEPNICPSAFLNRRKDGNRELTIACLGTMEGQLRFNICGIESSHIRNDDIADLESRIEDTGGKVGFVHLNLPY